MSATSWQIALRESQKPVTAAVKDLGFRKIGNYYNRKVNDDLVQVIGFQSGQAVSIYHGHFTVNLGVYVPSLANLEGNASTGRAISDAHCEIRSRLSNVSSFGNDKWWPLDQSSLHSGEVIAKALLNHGIPFLDRYASHQKIIDRFQADGSLPFRNPARSKLAVAVIYWASGAVKKSIEMFESAAAEPSDNSRFSDYVSAIKTRCGF